MKNDELRTKVKNYLSKCLPEGDQYIILPEKKKSSTASGFVLADEGRGERKDMKGEIVAKGLGRLLEGTEGHQRMEFDVGQTVLFRKFAGDDLFYDEHLEIHPSHTEDRDDLVAVKVLRQEAILYALP